MKYRTVLAVIASAAISFCAQAQNLPGPASGGWYVLIGSVPEAGVQRPETTGNRFFDSMVQMSVDGMIGKCYAAIFPSSEKNATEYKLTEFAKVFVTKKFGPFESERAAEIALKKSGWSYSNGISVWMAESGCLP
jgi:hypothetical protein